MDSNTIEIHPVNASGQDLFSECTSNLEYIIDELFPEVEMNVGRQKAMNWMGWDDLII